MTLEQLRIFVAVAEREHVTQASLALNLTQSAVSAAIAAIERQYATQLFDRIGRRVALTSEGRVFLDEAKAVLARAAMAEATLAEFAGLRRGSLSLAASQTIGNYWLPKFIHRFAVRHPGVAMKLVIANTRAVAALTREGAADLGFIEGTVDDAALALESVGGDELVLVAAPGVELDVVEPARGLRSARFVVREAGSGTRETFEAALPALGVGPHELDVVLELPSNEAVRSAAEAGAGVAALSKLVVENSLKAGILHKIPIALPMRRFFALRLKERRLSAAAQAFCALLAEERDLCS
jgi:DNA-binding transcriptional LysR family regulator